MIKGLSLKLLLQFSALVTYKFHNFLITDFCECYACSKNTFSPKTSLYLGLLKVHLAPNNVFRLINFMYVE